MARTKREEPEGDFEEVEEATEESVDRRPTRGPQPPRLSITLPQSARRKIRLAAAVADMSESEWAKVVLATAAKKTVEKAGF
jgi:hypothetical protein